MQFSTGAVALWCLSVGGAAAFSTPGKITEEKLNVFVRRFKIKKI
jgi:hypothetical protein